MEKQVYPVSYWVLPEHKKMFRRVSETQADLLVVQGRDLSKAFDHRHTRVYYPSAARLEEDLRGMSESTMEAWEDLLNEYLQVNKVKLDRISEYRQMKFNQTGRIS